MATNMEATLPRVSAETQHLLEDLDLNTLSDDQFFGRLTSLRQQHKQTLKHYEQLYHDKLMAETGGDIGVIFGEPLFGRRQSADGADERQEPGLCINGIGITPRSAPPTLGRTTPLRDRATPPRYQATSPRDQATPPRDHTTPESPSSAPESPFSAPDPAPVFLTAPDIDTFGRDYQLSLLEPVNTGGDTFNQSLELMHRSVEKPPVPKFRKPAWTEQTRDEYWQAGVESDEDEYDQTKYHSGLSRIDTMWDDFHIDDYRPIERKNRPRSVGSMETTNWRHRITMPKPFQMTLREEAKEKTKSRTLEEYEHQKAMDRMDEQFECDKKFRAAPVPAHVYLPLYDALNEKAESRRRANTQAAKEILLADQKPFKFSRRDQLTDHTRRHSAPNLAKQKQFKARPIPKAVKQDVSERILEEEEYRKIRIRMRAQELLRSSSLPPNMASREDYTVGRLKEKLKEEKERSKKFQPRIKKNVPDFDTIHRKQRKEAANRYKGKVEPRTATVCQPFQFRSTSIPSNMDRVLADIEDDEKQLKENRWPYKNPRAKPKLGEVRHTFDSLPAQSTAANDLRRSKNQDQLKQLSNKEVQDRRNRDRQTARAKERRKDLATKTQANDRSRLLRESQDEKVRKFKEDERSRTEEYKKELEAMQDRVSKQPFLFERQAQLNARKRAEKRYTEVLRNAGIDEASLSQAYRSSSITDQNLTDEDEDYHYSHSFVDDDEDITEKDVSQPVAS